MKQAVKGINLLPKEYIQEQKIKRYKRMGSCIIIAECLLFCAIIIAPPKMKIKEQQKELDALQVKLDNPKYEGVNKAIADLQKARNDLAVWTEKYSALKRPSFISARVLDSVTARIPTGVVISGMAMTPTENTTGGVVSVEGVALDYNSIFSYVTILENTYGSENVSFTADRQEAQGEDEKNYIKYTITVNVKGTDLAPKKGDGATTTTGGTLAENAENITDGGQTS